MENGKMPVNIGKGIRLDVDTSRFTANVNEYVFAYGLRQILADSHAAIKKDGEEDWLAKSRALAEKKLAAMYAGEIHQRSERLDPIESEARRMALIDIQAAVRKSGRKLNTVSNDQYAALVNKNFDKYMAAAKRVVEMRAGNKISVDLAELGL